MLTVAQLLEVIAGLDPDAQVVVGIINGPAHNAAYAEHFDADPPARAMVEVAGLPLGAGVEVAAIVALD